MALTPGTRLGVYHITEQIGAGGMGEVYRATDTNLKRSVAIKVLPTLVAGDADRLARFQREAEVLASLNHPNIAHIHGLEDAGGVMALVMELVEGDNLSARIARGPIPIDEALMIARQIAEALEAAHDRGIVHRDLKPDNIKVRPDGTVKVLDFGLAKAAEQASGEAGPAPVDNSPTIARMTRAGVILGTAAYMAPEQARGGVIDKRADLWAFGVVLMEMLTGTPLFAGESVSDIIAAVLTRQEDWTMLPAATPPAIRRLLRRCLEKDRKRRLSDAAAARLEIDDALASTTDGKGDAVITPSSPASMWRVALPTAVVAALVSGGLAWFAKRTPPPVSSRVTLTIVAPDNLGMSAVGTMGSTPQVSPDGSTVMFQGKGGLYVRRLDSLDVLKVPGSASVVNEAYWHTSSRVTFPAIEGATRRLLDVRLPDGAPDLVFNYSTNVRGGGWNDRGEPLLAGYDSLLTRGADGSAKAVSGGNGEQANGKFLLYPEFIPGTNDFLVLSVADSGDSIVCLATFSNGTVTNVTPLFANETAARHTNSGGGLLLLVKNDNLYEQHLNLTKRAMEGEPQLVVRGVASQPALGRADFSVADNGTIAWRPGAAALARVEAFDRHGKSIGTAGPIDSVETIRLSPADNARVLAMGDSPWLATLGDAGRSVLPRDVRWRSWLSDGRRLLGSRNGKLITRDVESGAVETIGDIPREATEVWMLSPDRQFILARVNSRVMWARIASTATAAAWTPIIDIDESQTDASFSPDGRFVLYDTDRGDIYVQPFPTSSRRQRIASGNDPVWRADGKEIVFVQDESVWSVAVSSPGGALAFGEPQKLFDGVRPAPAAVLSSQSLAVSPDGSRIFLAQAVKQSVGNVIHVMTAGLTPR